jgi:hypothetical protein
MVLSLKSGIIAADCYKRSFEKLGEPLLGAVASVSLAMAGRMCVLCVSPAREAA